MDITPEELKEKNKAAGGDFFSEENTRLYDSTLETGGFWGYKVDEHKYWSKESRDENGGSWGWYFVKCNRLTTKFGRVLYSYMVNFMRRDGVVDRAHCPGFDNLEEAYNLAQQLSGAPAVQMSLF